MQTTRREIDSFVARKSFKYNDVIDSKIVNLGIWLHFRLLGESGREFGSNPDPRSISSSVTMLGPSIRAGSEGWYRVIGPGQNVGMKTQPDGQPNWTVWEQRKKIAWSHFILNHDCLYAFLAWDEFRDRDHIFFFRIIFELFIFLTRNYEDFLLVSLLCRTFREFKSWRDSRFVKNNLVNSIWSCDDRDICQFLMNECQ